MTNKYLAIIKAHMFRHSALKDKYFPLIPVPQIARPVTGGLRTSNVHRASATRIYCAYQKWRAPGSELPNA